VLHYTQPTETIIVRRKAYVGDNEGMPLESFDRGYFKIGPKNRQLRVSILGPEESRHKTLDISGMAPEPALREGCGDIYCVP